MIEILLVDDHAIVRDGLQRLLAAEADFAVVGSVGNGQDAIEAVAELEPDIVVMAITMPRLNCVGVTKRIVASPHDTRVLCLSMHKSSQFVEAMLRAGASGFVVKDSAGKELIHAIRTVMDGHTYLSPAVTSNVINYFMHGDDMCGATIYSELTEGEREVMQLLDDGTKVRDIASAINLPISTVHMHRCHIMEKLNLAGNAKLVTLAVREELPSM